MEDERTRAFALSLVILQLWRLVAGGSVRHVADWAWL